MTFTKDDDDDDDFVVVGFYLVFVFSAAAADNRLSSSASTDSDCSLRRTMPRRMQLMPAAHSAEIVSEKSRRPRSA